MSEMYEIKYSAMKDFVHIAHPPLNEVMKSSAALRN